MTDIEIPEPSLGVGKIIGNSFKIWLQNIVPIYLVALIPQLIVAAIVFVLYGPGPILGGAAIDPQSLPSAATDSAIGNVVYSILNMVAGAVITAVVVRIAYDAVTHRGVNLGAALGGAIPHIIPIALLSLVWGIGVGLGMVLLIIPGLYLYAMWSVFAPAIVVERCGFSGLSRSAALTKGYRWPVLGAIILIMSVPISVSIVALFVIVPIALPAMGVYGAGIILIAFNSLFYGPYYVVTALIYARLREIKDGVGVQDLAEVFA